MKIAIIGTAPHWIEAPYTDPTWKIWATSPGNIGRLPRWDAWFETHRLARVKAEAGDVPESLLAFLKQEHGKPIFMADVRPEFPDAIRLPYEKLIEEFGELLFTSSIAFMFAMALVAKPEAIGLWGVDCAAVGEYDSQRPALQRFFEIARERGVKVVLPEDSLLRLRHRHYGVEEDSAAELAIWAKLRLLKKNKDEAMERHRQAVADINSITGAIAVLEDILHSRSGVPIKGDFS